MLKSKAEQIAQVNQDLEAGWRDLPLCSRREEIVPGEGNPEAELVFIGEAPGFQEVKERRPFVGKSGQLFRQTLKEVGLAEKDVYITNIVKGRPPDNRDPSPGEIEAFKKFLNRELEILDPPLVVTLGRFSMGKFLPEAKISTVHGRLHQVKWLDKKLFILPMYHPAAALRGTAIKMAFVSDFKKIKPALEFAKKKRASEAVVSEVEELLSI